MAIEDLFDCWVRIWRPAETRGTYREPDDDYSAVTTPTRPNGCMTPASGSLSNAGAGEKDVGRKDWFLDKLCDVRERDVLEITAGPHLGSRWRVDGQPDKPSAGPRNSGVFHHWEVVTVPWKGRLPLDSES